MIRFRKILVPTDFSDNASRIFGAVRQIANAYNSEVDLINVVPKPQYFGENFYNLISSVDSEEELYPKMKQEAEHKINHLMDEHIDSAYQGKTIVKLASKPPKCIVDVAKEQEYDLIMMATHGEHESNFLRGTITEKVIRQSKVPVFTADQPDFDQIKTIMVPIDGSMISLKALPAAVSLALNLGAEITLFHVQELYGTEMGDMKLASAQSKMGTVKEQVISQLETFFKESWNSVSIKGGEGSVARLVYKEGTTDTDIHMNIIVKKGVSAHFVITDYAEDHADIVVMTTHGRSGLSHLLLGSTAEKVARHLTRPVLTVKPDFDEMDDGRE